MELEEDRCNKFNIPRTRKKGEKKKKKRNLNIGSSVAHFDLGPFFEAHAICSIVLIDRVLFKRS